MPAWTRKRLFWLSILAVILIGGTWFGLVYGNDAWRTARYYRHRYLTEEGRFERISDAAYDARQIGDHETAEPLYREMREIRPDNPYDAFWHAVSLARLGREEESWQDLEAAVELGYDRPSSLEEELAFREMRRDARFELLLEKAREHEEERKARYEEASRPIDPSEAPAFDSLSDLQAHFKEEGEVVRALRKENEWEEARLAEARLDSLRRASLRRYLEDHPHAEDAEDAGREELGDRLEAAGRSSSRWTIEEAEAVREVAERLLAIHPDSPHRHEWKLVRAVSALQGIYPEGFQWDVEPRPSLRCDEAMAEFDTIETDAEASPWTDLIPGYRAICLYESEDADPDNIRALRDRFLEADEPTWDDRTLYLFYKRVARELRTVGLHIDGLPEFRVATLDGREVTLPALRGNVVLVDFWAPG